MSQASAKWMAKEREAARKEGICIVCLKRPVRPPKPQRCCQECLDSRYVRKTK